MTTILDETYLSLVEDDEDDTSPTTREWKVLIVNSDADAHQATVLALANTQILGRNIHFLHAYSARQAIKCLREETHVAALLLDVALRQDSSGLDLIRTIRQDLGLRDLRIILRAPDRVLIHDFGIDNDKARPELSRNSLYSTLSKSIRSYEQIHALNVGRRGLDLIIKASGRMMMHPSLRDFAASIISEISGLLRLAPASLVCSQNQGGVAAQARIIAATKHYAQHLDRPIDSLGNTTLTAALTKAFESRHSLFNDDDCVLFFSGKSGTALMAYFKTGHPLDAVDQQLLKVFCTNIAINLDNVALFDQLHDHAYNDQLLHIPNRLAFMHAVGDAIAAQRFGDTIAIIDIDHFSHINDALGYRYGDTLLKAVAHRLLDLLPTGTVVARLAADTFGVLGSHETISSNTLLPLFRDPFEIEGTEQSLTATIGFARLSEIDGNGSEAVKSANIALNLAKINSRGDGVFFTRDMELESRARLRLLRELRSAFDEERLFVVYQPQICLKTRRMIGVEALLRWQTDDGNFVPPAQFIPLAESSELIVGLGKWVLRTACHDLQRLVGDGFKDLRMAVNVSVMQFRHPDFAKTVDEVLAESGIDPKLLELEITESVAMLDASFMLDTLNQLKARGIAIAIDDFGTGFSSLSYLERLNVDRLKIDQSFISQMMQTESSLRIVETVIQLGHSLQLQVMAEGVEQKVQAELLESIGCHEAQGYLFARPMPFRELQLFLASPQASLDR